MSAYSTKILGWPFDARRRRPTARRSTRHLSLMRGGASALRRTVRPDQQHGPIEPPRL